MSDRQLQIALGLSAGGLVLSILSLILIATGP